MIKGDLKRKKILEAAEKLFTEKGFYSATIDELLEILQTSKGSLYHHFDSKQAILAAICEENVRKAFAGYQWERTNQALHGLDRLLYWALIPRKDQENFVSMLLPMFATPDGDVVMDAVTRAEEAIFFPELADLLSECRRQKAAFWALPALPLMLFQAFCGMQRQLMMCALREDPAHLPQAVLEILESIRFLFERCLDLPFGSLEILPASELARCLHKARMGMNSQKKE